MYARIGKSCPYNMSNSYQKFSTLSELERGQRNAMMISDKKFVTAEETYKNINIKDDVKTFLESPFHDVIANPEQTKLYQSKASITTR
jgi:hypothetical protein